MLSHLFRTRTAPYVVVNGQVLDLELLSLLTQAGLRIPAGRYWYDRSCGMWGYEGGGVEGVMPARLPLGGALAAHASAGRSGIFLNGRQLPASDVAAFQALGIAVPPGRYWCDASGSCGREGDMRPLVNLVDRMRRAGAALPADRRQRRASLSSSTPEPPSVRGASDQAITCPRP